MGPDQKRIVPGRLFSAASQSLVDAVQAKPAALLAAEMQLEQVPAAPNSACCANLGNGCLNR
jgi:hypothetical protein